MIYLFYGSDEFKVRTKAFEWIEAARKKQPDVAYARLTKEEMNPEALLEVTETGGLFVKRLLVLLDDPFAKARKSEDEDEEEQASVLDDFIERLATSDNVFVILAPKLLASKAKKISAKATKEYKFDARSTEEARGFNVGLVNALASKNKERLWLETVRALRAGDAPEMVHGLLHWKARTIGSRDLSLRLITLLQECRRTGNDLALTLEKFALSV